MLSTAEFAFNLNKPEDFEEAVKYWSEQLRYVHGVEPTEKKLREVLKSIIYRQAKAEKVTKLVEFMKANGITSNDVQEARAKLEREKF